MLDLAVELEIVKKSGSWFSYEGNRLSQGRDAVKNLLSDNPELMAELEAKIRAMVNSNEDALVDPVGGAEDGEDTLD